MAQIKLLKISSDGINLEMNVSADEITLASYTVQGGGPILDANLDMNNGAISDTDGLSFTDPATDGITTTSGTHAADKILFEDDENSMDVGSAILFPTITDVADSVDAFRVPSLAGAPSATPTDGGSGYLVFDDTNNNLYLWDGAAWDNLNTTSQAERICTEYTAGEILALGEVVYISAADTASKADTSGATVAAQVVGMAKAAALSAATVEIASEGTVEGHVGLTAGSRYYADPSTAGGITTTTPVGAGNTIVQIGYAKNTTTMHLHIEQLGRRA